MNAPQITELTGVRHDVTTLVIVHHNALPVSTHSQTRIARAVRAVEGVVVVAKDGLRTRDSYASNCVTNAWKSKVVIIYKSEYHLRYDFSVSVTSVALNVAVNLRAPAGTNKPSSATRYIQQRVGTKGSRFKSRPGGASSMFAEVTFLIRY